MTHKPSSVTPPEDVPVTETIAEAPVAPTAQPVALSQTTPQNESRLTKIKTAFLYVLIAGLAAAALTSVVALLVGQFNSTIGKALLTIFIFFTHSLLILAVLWADRYNQVGKLVLPTTIVVLVFASIITTTLGNWEIISAEVAWRAIGLYFLVLGAAFIVAGLLRLRLAQQATQIALYTSIGFIAATIVALIPWVLDLFRNFDPLYFRIIAALSILAAASFIIGVIIRGIALGQNESLKLTIPEKQPTTGGLLAVYITVGVITGIVWFTGFIGFIMSGVESTSPYSNTQRIQNSDRSRDYDYRR